MNETEKKAAKSAANIGVRVLTRCGVPEPTARVVVGAAVGAIVGALCAAGALTCTGCTTTFNTAPDGGVHYEQRVDIPLVSDLLNPNNKNNE